MAKSHQVNQAGAAQFQLC